MAHPQFELSNSARDATSSAWFDYLQLLDPFRPDLFRYCRKLTGDVWDAEDLVQDALVHGFAKLASVHHGIANPRAYMLRIASNLWIDRIRRRTSEAASLARAGADPTHAVAAQAPAGDPIEMRDGVRDAATVLLRELPPQERAALVLKEAFDMSLSEIADVLQTSVGAVKAALHRGRGRLKEDTPSARPAPASEVVQRFVERYNARDLPGLLELMLDGAAIEMYGHVYEAGRDAFEREGGWFHHNFFNPVDGGPSDATWELADFRGQPVVLVLYGPAEARVVGSVMRLDDVDGAISRVRVYALCPDVVAEVADELGLPLSPVRLYRFPFRPV